MKAIKALEYAGQQALTQALNGHEYADSLLIARLLEANQLDTTYARLVSSLRKLESEGTAMAAVEAIEEIRSYAIGLAGIAKAFTT